jgi:PIN domain nuclease of toxin-antitoxin system
MILLDTHALIWLARDPAKLSKAAAHAIRTASETGGLAISAITIWELAWLATHGRLNFTGTVDDLVERLSSRTAIRPITPRIAILASQLPATYSRDSSDRLIGATALVEGIALVTKDRALRNFDQIRAPLNSTNLDHSRLADGGDRAQFSKDFGRNFLVHVDDADGFVRIVDPAERKVCDVDLMFS